MHQNDIELDASLPHERNAFQKHSREKLLKLNFKDLLSKVLN